MRICNKYMHELEDDTKKCPYCNAWQYTPPTKKQDTFNAVIMVSIVIIIIIMILTKGKLW